MFYGKEGNMTATAAIDENGNYEMKDAPLGECTITVTVPDLNPMAMRSKAKGPKMPEGPRNPESPDLPLPSGAKWPKEVVPIDPKYSKPDTSGLKFTVQKGEQTHNIEL